MKFATLVGPLVAFVALFQTVVFLVLPIRRRAVWAPMTVGLVGGALVAGAALLFGAERIGLGAAGPGHLLPWGMGALAAASVLGTVLLAHPGFRPRLADPRVAAWTPKEAVVHIALRIPVMTALIEEAVFRGVLHSALSAVYRPSVAMGIGAVLFGLWHIGPAIDQCQADRTGGVAGSLRVALTVVATTVAGFLLVWLRTETGSIWTSFVVHATLNMTLAVFARLASRRTTDRGALPYGGVVSPTRLRVGARVGSRSEAG